jgi:hypothetical protein
MKLRQLALALSGLGLCTGVSTVGAWQIELRSAATDRHNEVWVSNKRPVQNSDIYVAWLDPDAADGPNIKSWHLDGEWRPGLMPVGEGPFDLGEFPAVQLTRLDTGCPDTHRCFLAMVAVAHGETPLDVSQWNNAALLPLNSQAAAERLPGQTYFLPHSGTDQNRGNGAEITLTPEPPSAAAPEDSSGNAAVTEKPDIFRLEGTQVLYANGQARRLQVIDVSDPAAPALAAWAALDGQPLEVYRLHDFYGVLQTATDENATDGRGWNSVTRLTLLKLNEDGELTVQGEHTVDGHFIESRRRNETIYTVSSDYEENYVLKINALHIDTEGNIQLLETLDVSAHNPEIAIFSDYLVVAGHDSNDWQSTMVQVFDLRDAANPLQKLPEITVPGQIPSEFHIDVSDTHLRLVYGPTRNAETGSTLAIYDLANELSEVGSVGGIAPGEALFATRFNGQYGYVVTYERTDPLWVIDLIDPANPVIKGELVVPGWSEKLFFHDNQLFAVGIDDQPLPDEEARWVRRVTTSLFDVSDPTAPTRLGSYTPLAGEVTYSWSPAWDDERALLLDWSERYAALPVESWETGTGTSVELVTFEADDLKGAGSLPMNVQVQRTLELAPQQLGVLGDQIFLTMQWGQGDPVVLGELELAQNLNWLELKDGMLWSLATGNRGFHAIYRYPVDDLDTDNPGRWPLSRGFDGAVTDEERLVMYSFYPLAVQVFERDSETLWNPAVLAEGEDMTDWYPYGAPLVHDGRIYVTTQQRVKPTLPMPVEPLPVEPVEEPVEPVEKPADSGGQNADGTMTAPRAAERPRLPMPEVHHPVMLPDVPESQYQWILRSWTLTENGAQPETAVSIPGEPLGFSAGGLLMTRESGNTGMLLNLVELDSDTARLLGSLPIECASYGQVKQIGGALYITCEQNYYPPVVYMDTAETADIRPGPQVPEPEMPKLLKIQVDTTLTVAGEWRFEKTPYVLAAAGNLVTVRHGYGWYGGPAVMESVRKARIAPLADSIAPGIGIMPPYNEECGVYDLSGSDPVLVRMLDECPWDGAVVMDMENVYSARGFAGLKAEAVNP